MNETNNTENLNLKKEINIAPIGKGKRMLVFLGDLFITFMIAVFLLNIAVLPIGKVSSNYDGWMDEIDVQTKNRNEILYGNQLLFYEYEEDKNNFESNLYYSGNKFVEQMVLSNETKYDVLATYFISIKNEKNKYLEIYQIVDEEYGFLLFEDGQIKLKPKYIEAFAPAFDKNDEMSENAKKDYELFLQKIFLNSYSYLIEDIQENDLTYLNYSYIECQNAIADANRYYDLLVLICTYISFLLAFIICYLVYPLINKNGKTMTMSIIKIERVGINNIYLLKKGEVALSSIYNLVSNFVMTLFLPLPNVMFSYVFAIGGGTLFVMSALSFALIVASFFVILFNQFNRSLFDILSRTVMISTESLDEIYRLKGYEI